MQSLQEYEEDEHGQEFAGDDSLVEGERVIGVSIVIEGKDHQI